MAYRFSPSQFVIGFLVLLVLTACGAGSDETESSFSMELVAEGPGISLDGVEIPVGEPTAVGFGQSIVTGETGRGLLSAGDLNFELFEGTQLQFLGADRLEVRALLKAGHLAVESAQETEVRLRLDSPNATITSVSREFEATVCQGSNGTSCLYVGSGEFDWLSGGEYVTVRAGESEFALIGEPPGPKRCVSEDDFIGWFDAARRNEAPHDLGGLVAGAPECAEGSEDDAGEVAEDDDHGQGGIGGFTGTKIPFGFGMAPVDIETPVIGTDTYTTDPAVYREPRPLDGPRRFHIDQRMISNSNYYAWLVSEAGTDPDKWSELAPDPWLRDAPEGDPTGATFPAGDDNNPVFSVRSQAAERYCRFTDKHLATEIEWELAAVVGVLDDLGSAREWVAEWDEYGPGAPAGQQVVRGQNLVDQADPYYRFFLADVGDQPVARAEVGFRCAAPEVAEPQEEPVEPISAAYSDDFCNNDRGWTLLAGGGFDIGYHPPCFYHVESNQDHHEVAVMSGSTVSQLTSVETDVLIRNVGDAPGNFRYGLIVGSAQSGYLLFTIQPEQEGDRFLLLWCVEEPSDPIVAQLGSGERYASSAPANEGDPNRHRGEKCAEDGAVSDRVAVENLERLNTLTIRADDAKWVSLTINGAVVGEAPVAMPTGDFGFFVQTYHKDLAHIHFDRLSAFGS